MKAFPNKIILSQDKESEEIYEYWLIKDYTDSIQKTYVPLDRVCELLESINLDYYQIREGMYSKDLVKDFRKLLEDETVH